MQVSVKLFVPETSELTIVAWDTNIVADGNELGLNLKASVVEELLHLVGVRDHLVTGEQIDPNLHYVFCFLIKIIQKSQNTIYQDTLSEEI